MRPQPILPSVIETDQTGFMVDRATDVNLRRLFTNIHAQHLNEGSLVVASLDIEKAFDAVEWPFLWQVLRRMAFPLLFIMWLQVLYKHPTTAIKLGGGSVTALLLVQRYATGLSGPLRHCDGTAGGGPVHHLTQQGPVRWLARGEGRPVCGRPPPFPQQCRLLARRGTADSELILHCHRPQS